MTAQLAPASPARPIPILVKTWSSRASHRFRYIRRSLPDLLASDLPDTAHVIVVDDVSDDPRLLALLERLAAVDRRVEVWRNPRRLGPNGGQEYNVPRLLERHPDAEFLVFCDDDVVYHRGWLQRTVQVAHEARAAGLRGVFTALNVPYRQAYDSRRLPTSEVLLKERQAALNWVVPREIYDEVGPFKDAGIAYDTEYCDRMAALKLPVICLKPSWVQNIGYFGAYQSGTTYTAPDYVGRIGVRLAAEFMLHTTAARLREWGSTATQPVRRLFRSGSRS
jgi:GT2 family glycosyltransferase